MTDKSFKLPHKKTHEKTKNCLFGPCLQKHDREHLYPDCKGEFCGIPHKREDEFGNIQNDFCCFHYWIDKYGYKHPSFSEHPKHKEWIEQIPCDP